MVIPGLCHARQIRHDATADPYLSRLSPHTEPLRPAQAGGIRAFVRSGGGDLTARLKARTDRGSVMRGAPEMTAIESKTRFGRIVHRVASAVGEMNYAQRRAA